MITCNWVAQLRGRGIHQEREQDNPQYLHNMDAVLRTLQAPTNASCEALAERRKAPFGRGGVSPWHVVITKLLYISNQAFRSATSENTDGAGTVIVVKTNT